MKRGYLTTLSFVTFLSKYYFILLRTTETPNMSPYFSALIHLISCQACPALMPYRTACVSVLASFMHTNSTSIEILVGIPILV